MLDKYQEWGWAVIPLAPNSKVPITKHGVKDAQYPSSWGGLSGVKYQGHNWGVATGKINNIIVIDVDERNGGYETQDSLPLFDNTYIVSTPGGLHYYYQYPNIPTKGKLGKGIDVKSDGGYVVSPPSTVDGKLYQTINNIPPNPLPQWMLDIIRVPEPTEIVGIVYDPNDDRPGSVWASQVDWADILEEHGWSLFRQDGDVRYWTRPGKDDGVSATTNYYGNDLLHVFTSSTEFEEDKAYNKFAAYTILNHDGDYTEAARELKEYVPNVSNTVTSFRDTKVRGPSFTPAFEEGHFVGRYIEYAAAQTDAPKEYHEAAALTALAVCTPNVRGTLAPYPGGLATNLYTILVGPTTIARKSTAQKIDIKLIEAASPQSPLPARATPEALIDHLSAKSGVATIWTPDEFGVTLSQIYTRDYLRGLEELLLTLYGGDTYQYVKVAETVVINRPHLNVLAAATPESLGLAGPAAGMTGLIPRFGIVFPELGAMMPAKETPDLSQQRVDLHESLRKVMQFSQENKMFSFTNDALKVLNASEMELSTGEIYVQRLPTMLFKVAMCSAASRLSSVVEEDDARSAVVVINRWAEGAGKLQKYLRKRQADLEFEKQISTAISMVKDSGGTLHRAYVARELSVRKSVLDQIESTMVDRGIIDVDRSKEGTTWRLS